MDRTPNTYKFSILVLMCFIIAMGMIISSLNPVLFKYCAGEPVDLDVEINEGFIVDIWDEALDENNDTSYDTLYSKFLDKGKYATEWGMLEGVDMIGAAIAALIGGAIANFFGFKTFSK